MNAFGNPFLCSAQCTPKEGQTFQELGECLSKRVQYVVCKPARAEIGNGTQTASRSSASSAQSTSASGTASGSASRSASASGSAAASQSTGAASAVQATTSKAGFMVFGVLALGTFAGMLL